MVRAVIFDCDGVLVDTEPTSSAVLAGLLSEAGLAITPADCRRAYTGRAMGAILADAAGRLGEPLPLDLATRFYALIEETFARELEPVPGVVDALAGIALPDCVASSGPHHKMAVTLRTAGLWDRFEGRIFSASEVSAGKPAPDLFLHAARAMGFDPESTAVVEDSVAGVEAAVAAGMRAFAFARHVDAERLARAGGEVFDDMAELPGLLVRG